MPVKVRPLHDRIIVERLEDTEQVVGGIIIPDTAKEKPQQGKVIAAGKGKIKDDGTLLPLDVKSGDTTWNAATARCQVGRHDPVRKIRGPRRDRRQVDETPDALQQMEL